MKTVFNHCTIVQCPTEDVKKRLEKWKCRAELRVISNGMIKEDTENGEPVELKEPAVKKTEGTFLVVTAGRYSVEKDQMTLLRAMRYSKFADRINLVIAGKGPLEMKLKTAADRLVKKGVLKHPPVLGFYALPELKAIYREADLYIHCATVEVEGMSCMEAVQTGLVPVIAKGKLSSTHQFALSDESLYHEGNAKELAERIDYWLSDDERRRIEAALYIGMDEQYDIGKSISELQKMFREAVQLKTF